jgi:hypothetical protein
MVANMHRSALSETVELIGLDRHAILMDATSCETRYAQPEGTTMSVARVTEITSTSQQSFEDGIRQGIARATSTLRM